jgi:hypothetical protein
VRRLGDVDELQVDAVDRRAKRGARLGLHRSTTLSARPRCA